MKLSFLDMSKGFDVAALITLGGIALLGVIVGSLVKVKNKSTGREKAAGIGGVEAFLLAIIGGFIARTFIWLLLLPLDNIKGGGIIVGHLFFLIPSVVDDFIALGGSRVLTTPPGLLFLATVVGAFTAMMDGVWRIHNWKGLGWLSFPLDMTWGLAGQNYGLLLHLINFAWGDHATETRENGHRYQSGFGLKPTFAFTEGSVMSNLSDAPGTDLYRHEMTHIWQNRMFGPFYTLNYIGWMVIWFIPGLIAGATCKKTPPGRGKVGVGKGIERFCYFNCPWEVWGYAVQKQDRKAWGPEMIWSAVPVIIIAVFIFGGITALWLMLYGIML